MGGGRTALILLIAAALGVAGSACTASGTSPSGTALGAASSSIVATASPAATSAVTPTSHAASLSGESTQVRPVSSQVVPAGGSVDVPIDFEGSTAATILLSTTSSSISASIAGTDLTAAQGMPGYLAAQLADPVNGDLHVVNSGSSDAGIAVMLMIQTTRTLTITTSSYDYAHGAEVSFDVVLTDTQAGDTVTAKYRDPDGTLTPITLTPAGDGHWTGQFTPAAGGVYTILASVGGSEPRAMSTEVDVASGTVSLSSTFSERLVDTDGDGLANQLVLTPTVTVQNPGRYNVTAYLRDASGAEIDVTGGLVDLVAGSQPLDFAFDGQSIYKSGKSGPYQLAQVYIESPAEITELSVDDMGTTQPYDYRKFQHFPVLIDPSSLALTPLDADSDGLYEALHLTGQVRVDAEGSYEIAASLFAADGTEAAQLSETVDFVAGANSFAGDFEGTAIWASKSNGPYTVGPLSVSLASDWSVDDTLDPAIESSAYTFAQFAQAEPAPKISPTQRR